jgi:hypothetical protein
MVRGMVEAAIAQAVADAVAEAMGTTIAGPVAEPERKPEPWTKAARASKDDRRNGPRVAYVVKVGKRGAMPKVPDFGGFVTAAKTWKAISKARGPVTKPAIMSATGLGKKTVESCIHYLIHAGLIVSQPVE